MVLTTESVIMSDGPRSSRLRKFHPNDLQLNLPINNIFSFSCMCMQSHDHNILSYIID